MNIDTSKIITLSHSQPTVAAVTCNPKSTDDDTIRSRTVPPQFDRTSSQPGGRPLIATMQPAFITPLPLRATHRTDVGTGATRAFRHVVAPRRRRVHTPEARLSDAPPEESALLDSIKALQSSAKGRGIHTYAASDPRQFEKAVQDVAQLEINAAGFGAPARLRALLPAVWQLVLTDSDAVRKNAGSVTGLGSLPGARCTRVDVVLAKDGRAKTVEKIEVFGGLMNGENALVGKWTLTGKAKSILEVTYASAVLMGKSTVRADSKAVLKITYCSRDVRIGRSESGDFYVFVRDDMK